MCSPGPGPCARLLRPLPPRLLVLGINPASVAPRSRYFAPCATLPWKRSWSTTREPQIDEVATNSHGPASEFPWSDAVPQTFPAPMLRPVFSRTRSRQRIPALKREPAVLHPSGRASAMSNIGARSFYGPPCQPGSLNTQLWESMSCKPETTQIHPPQETTRLPLIRSRLPGPRAPILHILASLGGVTAEPHASPQGLG